MLNLNTYDETQNIEDNSLNPFELVIEDNPLNPFELVIEDNPLNPFKLADEEDSDSQN